MTGPVAGPAAAPVVPTAGRVTAGRALIVAHHHTSSPGWVGRYLADRGYRLETVLLGTERPVDLPSPDGFDVVVVLGSSHSVIEFDDPASPNRRWITAEVDWIAAAVTGGARVLGICFGAQAMSKALGGTVTRMPTTQVGWYDLVPADGADPVLAGPWLEYHDDRFTVPDGARLLAADRFCPQAFTIGRSLAVQFHPEADLAIVQGWVDRFATDEAALAVGIERHGLLARTATSQDASAQRCLYVMDAFLALGSADAGEATDLLAS